MLESGFNFVLYMIQTVFDIQTLKLKGRHHRFFPVQYSVNSLSQNALSPRLMRR